MKRFLLTLGAGYLLIVFVLVFLPRIHSAVSGPGKTGDDLFQPASSEKKNKTPQETDAQVASKESEEFEEPVEGPDYAMKAEYGSGALSGTWTFSSEESKEDVYKGNLKLYYESGVLWMTGDFVNGRPHGTLKWYYPSGTLREIENFHDGQLHGMSRIFYPSGVMWVERYYKDGRLDSMPKLFSESGEEKRALEFQPTGEQPTSYFKALNPGGQVDVEWNPAGESGQTSIKTYYLNNQLSSQWNLLGKTLEGSANLFHPTGQIWIEQTYKENVRELSIKKYHPNGQIWMETSLTRTGLEDVTWGYYPSGKVWFMFRHRNVKKEAFPEIFSEIQRNKKKDSTIKPGVVSPRPQHPG